MAFETSEYKTDVQPKGSSEADQLACSVFDDLPEYRPPQCKTVSNANGDLGTGKAVDPSKLPASVWDDLPGLRPPGKGSDDLGTGKVVDPSELPDSIWDDLPELRPSRPISGVKKDVVQAEKLEPRPHELKYVDRSGQD